MTPLLRAVSLAALLICSAASSAIAQDQPSAPADTPAPLTNEQRDRLIAAVQPYRTGNWKGSVAGFTLAAQSPTPIAEYVLYLLGDSLSRLNDPEAAAAAALQAADRAAEGPLAPAALLLAGEQALRAGRNADAAGALRRFLDRFPEHPDSPRARFALAQALQASGQAAEAARLYRQVWLQAPASSFADPSATEERLLAERSTALPPPTARERLDRAERLLNAGRLDAARGAAEAVLAERPETEVTLRALRVVAESSRRLGKHDAAAQAVDRGVATARGSARAFWLLERARLQQRQSRDGALAVLVRIVQEHPRTPEAPEALLLSAKLLEDAGQTAEGEATYLRLAAEYPDDADAGAALWRAGWLAWLRASPGEAEERWGRLFKARGGQGYREPASYWLGRLNESRGQREAAERQFVALVSEAPRSYYGVLAAGRLAGRERPAVASGAAGSAGQRPAPRPTVVLPADPLGPVRRDPAYIKADALRSVGLGEFAEAEVEDLGRRAAGDPLRTYGVAAVHAQDARYHLAIRLLRREFAQHVRAGDGALPRTFWEMLYPVGWRDSLLRAANRVALDPMLVAAVVREESSFFPGARSRVGARGLMQLMPETARPMARQQGLDFRSGDLLDDPEANLDIGTLFLSNLMRQFGDARLAVAAYNAGPGRVREWMAARRPDDLEVWVELIPFTETRGFVKRVMLSWDEYRRLYAPPP